MEDFNQLFDDHLFNIDKAEDKTSKLKEGERRMVSILFADIKGFTSLSETLDHEEVQSLMDQLMKIFSHSVDVHGGYVDKYTGDQIMALFGAKHASEVDTQRAINTGLDMLAKLEKFNSILKNSPKYSSLDINLSIRVGINTGMVTTGAIGKEREGDYTVYGDSVNLASRMESNAPTNTIMLPEETMTLVEAYFHFKDHGNMEVKGKSEPVSVFIVKSKKDIQVKHSTPFIGRESELQKMNEIYNKALKNLTNDAFNKIHFISSVADAGVGKSRLVYEFIQSNANIQTDNSFSIAHASNISSQPYYLFTTLLKDIFKISEVDSLSVSKEKLDTRIKEIEDFTKISLKDSLPFIGFLLGIKYEDERLNNREEIQNNINISVRTLLESVCQFTNLKDKPYIFILDDLHWIDKMSMDLLIFLVSTFDFKNKNVNKNKAYPLFLLTFRSHYTIPEKLLNEIEYTQMDLEPLTKEYSLDLINFLTKDIDIDDTKKKELYEKSKGNPFFIEEWVNLIQEKNTYAEVLEESRGISEYSIPNSINALILARIDGLDKTLKSLLQKATIIGEDFFLQILSKLEQKLGFNKDIDKPVHDLEDENFIQHFINQLDHYKFKHILTRDVAYSTILKSNKKILHKSVAEVIEESFQDKLEMFYFDLAVHYDMSGNNEKAIKFLMLAGLKNFFIFDYTHASECFERITTIVETDKTYEKVLNISESKKIKDEDKNTLNNYMKSKLYIGKILLSTGQWDDGLKILEPLKEKLSHISSETVYGTYFSIGKTYALKRQHEKAIENFKESLAIAKNNNYQIEQGLCIGELAHLAFDIGNTEAALKGFTQELELFEKLKSSLNTSIAYGHLGMFYFQNGDMDKALDYFKKNYDISSKHDAKQQVLLALGNISLIHNIRGEYDKSLNIFKEVLDISEDINDLRNQVMTYGNQGIIFKNLGKYETSLENYNKQLEISMKMDDLWQQSNAHDGIGVVYHKLRQYDKSENEVLKAIEIKEKIKDQNGYASCLNNLAETYVKLGKIKESEESLNKAVNIFKELNNERSMYICSVELAKTLVFKEDYSSGCELVKNALDYFIQIKDIPSFIKNAPVLANLYINTDNTDKAKEILQKTEEYSKSSTNSIKIELSIIDCIENKSDKMLKDLLDTDVDDESAAYIHYNIGKILDDKNELDSAKKIYTKLYNKYKDFTYKFYLDKIK